jgi:Fe-S-cluster containining protein
MEIKNRLILLKTISGLYNDFIADQALACRKTCAVCCTCNVTLSTLEGFLIIDRLTGQQRANLFDRLQPFWARGRFQPTISINQMAQMCLQGIDIPEESADPRMGDCPLLEENICPIYSSRPFTCRSMLSTVVCSQGGEARISPFVLTVNQTILQYLEAIDTPGFSGNLIDILSFLSDPLHLDAYQSGQLPPAPAGLTTNITFSVLMIPPEHRSRMTPLLQKIQQAIVQARKLS